MKTVYVRYSKTASAFAKQSSRTGAFTTEYPTEAQHFDSPADAYVNGYRRNMVERYNEIIQSADALREYSKAQVARGPEPTDYVPKALEMDESGARLRELNATELAEFDSARSAE
jgi:hypothetical protein